MLNTAKKLIKSSLLQQVRIPDNIEDVTSVSAESECKPAAAGLSHMQVQTIWKGVEDLYKTGMYPGLSFCIRRHGNIVLNRTLGHAHGNGPKDQGSTSKTLLTPQTPVCLFSSSKAITAVIMHMLVERELISLSDPVSLYLPEFSSHGKKDTSILQMLSHQGGIPGLPDIQDIELEDMFDPDTALQMLYEMKPMWRAGTKVGYHPITSGYLFGEIVKVVTGKDIRHFIDENIRKPLGFRHFSYGVNDDDLDKVAREYFTGVPLFPPVSTFMKKALGVGISEVIDLVNDPRFMQSIIPAGNIIGTAEEATAFYQILLNGGELNGKRIMDSQTVQNAIKPVTKKAIDHTVKMPTRYSAGLMLGSAEGFSVFGPDTESAYGHLGFANNFCWADPDRDIAVALLTTGNPILGNHIGKLVGLLSLISENCPAVVAPESDSGAVVSLRSI